MPNATAVPVISEIVSYSDEKVTRDLDAVVQDYLPNIMVGLTASGYVQYCDDSQPVTFLGLVENSVAISVQTGDVAGVRRVWVKRPYQGFTMKIASAALTDVGRAVFARFNNEATYGPPAGVTLNNYNWIGNVKEVKIATSEVLIVPPPWNRQGLNCGLFQSAASGSQTLSALHLNKLIECNLSGPLTITLPPLSQTSMNDELEFMLMGSLLFQLTLAGSGTDKISTAISYGGMNTAQYSYTKVKSDGNLWLITGKI